MKFTRLLLFTTQLTGAAVVHINDGGEGDRRQIQRLRVIVDGNVVYLGGCGGGRQMEVYRPVGGVAQGTDVKVEVGNEERIKMVELLFEDAGHRWRRDILRCNDGHGYGQIPEYRLQSSEILDRNKSAVDTGGEGKKEGYTTWLEGSTCVSRGKVEGGMEMGFVVVGVGMVGVIRVMERRQRRREKGMGEDEKGVVGQV